MDLNQIRNFCIIAHIDHGKSTLADRFLEITRTIAPRQMKHAQMLDTMDLEQERGITIKLQPVRMDWEYQGQPYVLNLIDTPGHVDFSYEVSRSLAACEGAILVVDATQGIEAQTLAHSYLALEHNLEVIPVLNKIDLPAAEVSRRAKEIEAALGLSADEIIAVSAKKGTGVDHLLACLVEKVPAPVESGAENELKALIFDSIYDSYRGVVAYIRIKSGRVKKGDRVMFLHTESEAEVLEVGYFRPQFFPVEELREGEIGYIITGLKEIKKVQVGDTIWQSLDRKKAFSQAQALAGYQPVRPYVFAAIFCVEGNDFPLLRQALEKLKLNDSALSFEVEQSSILGNGFRVGFLGMLHLEVIQERLEREYNLDLVVTAPSVVYRVKLKNGSEMEIYHPSFMPEQAEILEIQEPWVKLEILTPKSYIGAVSELIKKKRGLHKDMHYLDEKRVVMIFEMPLATMVVDFYDRLKSVSAGYASLSYNLMDYRVGELVRLDICLVGERVEALSTMIHRLEAARVGAKLCKRLKELIPRAQFEIAIQAAIGNKIIARETLSAMRKDVTAKLYGGDRSRKDKLLKKQKAGKKRLKKVGRIELPQEVFLAMIKH